MPFRPGLARNRPGPARANSDWIQRENGSTRNMGGGASAGIGARRICAISRSRRTQLSCDRKHQRTPLLLRCGVSAKSQKARRNRHRLVLRIQGPVPRGRRANRREAQEHLPRLLSVAGRTNCRVDLRFNSEAAVRGLIRNGAVGGAWNTRVSNTRSSRRSIHQAGNGRLSATVGPPNQESHSIERRPSAQRNGRSAN